MYLNEVIVCCMYRFHYDRDTNNSNFSTDDINNSNDMRQTSECYLSR